MSASADRTASQPQRAGLVLTALILVAAVANLNLAVANVALPSIGEHFDSSQTALDLVAVGYSLGLACSVLWLGALGDRYGRKMMLSSARCWRFRPRCSPRGLRLTSCSSSRASAAASRPAWPTRRPWLSSPLSGRARGGRRRSRSGRASAARSRRSGRSLGAPARAFLVGLRVPPDPSACGGRDRDGYTPRARARERRRPSPSTTSAESSRSCSSAR